MTSLREALGLPLHNIFDSGIYNEYVHNKTVEPDAEDTDHGAIQPPYPPSTSTSTPTPTFPEGVNNSDSLVRLEVV